MRRKTLPHRVPMTSAQTVGVMRAAVTMHSSVTIWTDSSSLTVTRTFIWRASPSMPVGSSDVSRGATASAIST